MIWLRFLNDSSACCVANELHGARSKTWNNSWKEWLTDSCRCWGKVMTKRWVPTFLFIELIIFMYNRAKLKAANHVFWVQHIYTFSSLSWSHLIRRRQIHRYVWVFRTSFLKTRAVYEEQVRITKGKMMPCCQAALDKSLNELIYLLSRWLTCLLV